MFLKGPKHLNGSDRVDALDALRALAVVQMVQGHTLDALLKASVRQGVLFDAWRWTRGLTAPAFLFCAGFAFLLVYRKRPEGWRRRARRALALIALGYGLRAPWHELFAWNISASSKAAWAEVDVLQSIGVSILLLELLMRLPGGGRRVVLAIITCVCYAAGPGGLVVPAPVWLGNYLSQSTLFPLVPWFAHVALGCLFADALCLYQQSAQRQQGAHWRAFVPLALTLLMAAVDAARRDGVSHGLRSLGVVALFVAVAVLVYWAPPRLRRFARFVSAASLTVYVSHIVVVYADGVGLASHPGAKLSLPSALCVALLLLVLGLSLHSLLQRGRNQSRMTARSSGASV